jgi:hypothetical protein
MKMALTSILFILLPSFTIYCYGQKIEQKRKLSKQEYLERSKNQRNTGWILLGGGAIAVVTGAIIFDKNFDIWDETSDNAETGGVVLMGVGGAAMASSIFLFSQSMANKEISKELSAFIKINQAPQIRETQCYFERFPSLGISWYMSR